MLLQFLLQLFYVQLLLEQGFQNFVLELLLLILDAYGEKEMIRFIRKKVLPYKKYWDHPTKWKKAAQEFQKKYNVYIKENDTKEKIQHTI